MTIRNQVATIIEERGLTVAKISRMTGIHRNVLGSLYRNEVSEINMDVANALCKVLNVRTDDLFPYVPDDELSPDDKAHLEKRLEALQRKQKRWIRYKAQEQPNQSKGSE